MTFKKIWRFLVNRFEETSTVRGLLAAGVLLGGYTAEPARLDAWTTLAVFISALLKVVLPDKWGKADAKPKG